MTETFQLNVIAPGAGIPTGVLDGNCKAILPATTCTFIAPGMAGNVGTNTIYTGDMNFAEAYAPFPTMVVNPIGTTTSISSSLNPSRNGGSINLVADIVGYQSYGQVAFQEASTTLCTAYAGTTINYRHTRATCTVTLTAGTHLITAAYQGSSSSLPSASPPLQQVVNLSAGASTVTSLAISPGPSIVGHLVTFTSTVSGNSPTGTITINDGNMPLCTVTIGTATSTCAVPLMNTYAHTITATYAGDVNNMPSTSAALSVQAVPATSSTTLRSMTNPSSSGQSVTFSATVVGEKPGGTVAFYDGAVELCRWNLTAPTINCGASSLADGSHSLTAVYSGDQNNLPSTSQSVAQIVNPALPGVVLSSDSNPSSFNGAVTFTATVTGSSPTGYITINDGATPLCTTTLVSGSAQCGWSLDASIGSHALTAYYSGDEHNPSAASSVLLQVVTSGYVPVNPARLLDTRLGSSTVDSLGAGDGALSSRSSRILSVVNRGGVAATQVKAVVLNVTAVVPTGVGYLTVWPTDEMQPSTANLNLNPGYTIPNLVIASPSDFGTVSLYNGGVSSTDLVADVQGYFTAGSTYNPLSPVRVLDTRVNATASTVDFQYVGTGAIPSQQQLDIRIAGRDLVPNLGAGAGVLNGTPVNPAGVGYVTVWPTTEARPVAANLNLNPDRRFPISLSLKWAMMGKCRSTTVVLLRPISSRIF